MDDAMRARIEQLKRDGYRIETRPYPGRAVALWHDLVIADSDAAILLTETRHLPVVYFPRAHVKMAMLQRTAHTTHCPFKGDASYFSLVDGARRAENAVWSYESPIPDVAAIKDRLAFYTDAMGAAFGLTVSAHADAETKT